jgi:hypothetical protein
MLADLVTGLELFQAAAQPRKTTEACAVAEAVASCAGVATDKAGISRLFHWGLGLVIVGYVALPLMMIRLIWRWCHDLESLQSVRVFLPRDEAADNSICNAVATLEGTIMLARMFPKIAFVVIVAGAFSALSAQAQQATEIQLSYKDKKFDPAEISAPANTPIVIKLKNLDAKAMEFESKTLHVEKVVAGSTDATINVRAQKPGRYEFFDEYNEKTARGALVVK